MRRAVGIREVAAQAGVSTTTVSHALNGKGRIAPKTRQRVREIADRLGYVPNATARNLAGGRTGLIGLAVAQTGEGNMAVSDYDYFARLISSASVVALDCGYALMLASPAREDAWSTAAVDGAIVVDPVDGDPVVERALGAGWPLVTTGRIPGNDRECWVDNDHFAGTRAMLDHLAARGAERIALLASPPTTSYAIDSLAAYEEWCAEHHQETVVAVTRGDLTEGSGFEMTGRLLRRKRPPDAMHSTLDRLALGALLAAPTHGLSVPRDLLVSGCADSAASKWARPGLTTLELNPGQIGTAAVEMLTALIEEREPEPRRVHIPTTILARGSTKRRVRRSEGTGRASEGDRESRTSEAGEMGRTRQTSRASRGSREIEAGEAGASGRAEAKAGSR
ncbi:MAG TPA: LacI family DNA-binding transcriptional regulator [Solirubrobacteraceae bacterium]|nr:LacI family DNA-binding transcriptional regulator [Solirubrobacteraceae bacterium]